MLRNSLQDLQSNGEVGDWFIPENGESIWIKMPNPSQTVVEWPFARPLENGARWEWDGNREAPTVTPSIYLENVWHGWMNAGQLVESLHWVNIWGGVHPAAPRVDKD